MNTKEYYARRNRIKQNEFVYTQYDKYSKGIRDDNYRRFAYINNRRIKEIMKESKIDREEAAFEYIMRIRNRQL